MLAFILFFNWVLSVNPIKELEYECKDVGTDLVACNQMSTCKFYKISDREVWDLDTRLEVAMKSPDDHCDPTTSEIPCSITVNRFSFQLRQIPPTEFVGMRVDIWASYFDRWIPTNLTAIQADDWSDLWAYGGEFGNIVGLQPFDVMASVQQDCQLDPAEIEPLAVTLAADAGQVPAAVECTKIAEAELCSDDYTLNCEWNSDSSVCLLNNQTNNLLTCYTHGLQSTCEDDTLHPGVVCKWIEGTRDDFADALCVNDASAFSLIAFAFIMAFFF